MMQVRLIRDRDSTWGFLLELVREDDTLLSHKPERKGPSEEVEPREERKIRPLVNFQSLYLK